MTLENRLILDLTAYNQLVAEYNKYLESVQTEITPVIKAVNTLTYNESVAAAAAALALNGITLALLAVLKRKLI